MIIRPIKASEADEVGEMIVDSYVFSGHLSAESPYTRELRDVSSRLAYTWVAESDGAIVGTICLCPPDGASPAMICREGEYEFRFLAISPGSWSQGVGQALVAESEAQALARGAERMVISVINVNERALHFYALEGYTKMPERDWSPVRSPNPDESSSVPATDVRLLALTKELPTPGAG